MTVLSVNLNKVALMRNARDMGMPSVTEAARVCIKAGAGGITMHPRSDMRHARPEDLRDLKADIEVELNIEGNPYNAPRGAYPGFMEICMENQPAQCTLVPDSDDQKTSDHGWNLMEQRDKLRPLIRQLKEETEARVSLFMDPAPDQMALAAELGADRVELYTEPYARAFEKGQGEKALKAYVAAADAAIAAGMELNAGHDLTTQNLPLILARIPTIQEVSIGHALIADALYIGLGPAVQAYLEAIEKGHACIA